MVNTCGGVADGRGQKVLEDSAAFVAEADTCSSREYEIHHLMCCAAISDDT